MLYLTCTTITSVDLAHYGVSRAKDWVSVDCGTSFVGTSLCTSACIFYRFISSDPKSVGLSGPLKFPEKIICG